ACKKAKYLEAAPDKALNTLKSYSDYQAILNNTMVMNISPSIAEAAFDEYYVTGFSGTPENILRQQNLYTWNDDEFPLEWSLLYQIVFYANTVLDGLKGDDHVDARVIRGQALFHRAHTFFQLAQLY